MAQVESIPKTYEEAITTLAQWHGEVGDDDLVVYAAQDIGDNVVRLISVSDTFPDLGAVHVYRFGASDEFPFRSAIALARPEQWEKLQLGSPDLGLPSDWKVGNSRKVWPLSH